MHPSPIHLLMLAVLQEQDVDAATRGLEALGASVVHMASSGGFLRRKNVTLMVGVPDGREDEALAALQESCRERVEYLTMPLEGSPMPMPTPIPVTVGGATVFGLPVERFEEI